MADAGIPLHILKDILGLASIETTRGYLHHDNRHLASAREQANAFLSAAGQRKHARRSGPAPRGLWCAPPLAGVLTEPSGPLLVPLSTGTGFGAVRSSTCDHRRERRGTRGGPPKTTPGHEKAQVRNQLSPGPLRRADRI